MSTTGVSGWAKFPAHIRSLLWTQLFMNASHFMTVPLLALFLSHDLKLGPIELGTVMAVNLLCAQSLPLLAGPVIDRFGAKLAMVCGQLLRAVGLLGFVVSPYHHAILVPAACLMGSGVAIYETAVFGIFGREPRLTVAEIFAANNQMLNLGVIVGPAIGMTAGIASARLCFAGSAALFFVLAIFSLLRPGVERADSPRSAMLKSIRSALTDRDFRFLMAAAMPWYFLFPQLYVFFPIYLSRVAQGRLSALIYIVNGVVGVIFMVVAKRWLVATPPQRILIGAYAAAALLFASVSLSENVIWFFVFVGGYTVVETAIQPAIQTLASNLAKEGSQSTFFGTLSIAGAISGAAGYYTGSWLVLGAGRYEAWLIFGCVGLCGVIFSILFRSRVLHGMRPAVSLL